MLLGFNVACILTPLHDLVVVASGRVFLLQNLSKSLVKILSEECQKVYFLLHGESLRCQIDLLGAMLSVTTS